MKNTHRNGGTDGKQSLFFERGEGGGDGVRARDEASQHRRAFQRRPWRDKHRDKEITSSWTDWRTLVAGVHPCSGKMEMIFQRTSTPWNVVVDPEKRPPETARDVNALIIALRILLATVHAINSTPSWNVLIPPFFSSIVYRVDEASIEWGKGMKNLYRSIVGI